MIFTEQRNNGNEDTSFLSERVTRIEERAKSNTHRIDRLEKLADAIYRQNENIVRLVEKLETMNSSITMHEKRIREIEKIPRSRMNTVFTAIITAILSSLISAAVTFILYAK